MPRNRKIFIRNTAIAVTFRTQAGLPLVPTAYMREIIRSILVRALTLYNVTLCHALVMSNHVHLLLIVRAPQDVDQFIGYLKRESAHAINRLLGTSQRNVWCEGYDSPVILDAQKAIDYISYIYSNPVKAGLVSTIDDYPNLSTWGAFQNGAQEITSRRIPRSSVPVLPQNSISLEASEQLAENLMEESQEELTAVIEPDAWMQCFEETHARNPEGINKIIFQSIRTYESQQGKNRRGRVIGAHSLKLQNMRQSHIPKKRGRKMICLSTLKERRLHFLSFYKSHCKKAAHIFTRENSIAKSQIPRQKMLPLSLFAPGGGMSGNLLPEHLPVFQPN